MLILTFRLGPERYAIEANRITEVIPRVPLRVLPHAPASVAGLLPYRGRIVPVLDLKALVGHGPCADALSTRIMIVEVTGPAQTPRTLGLIADQVTDAQSLAADFERSPVNVPAAPYLGGVAADDTGILQLLRVERLLEDPEVIRLFEEPDGDAA